MSDGWFYMKSGVMGDGQVGPLSNAGLLALAEEEKLKPTTLLFHGKYTKGQWVPVSSVPAIARKLDEAVAIRKSISVSAPQPIVSTGFQPEHEIALPYAPLTMGATATPWRTYLICGLVICLVAFLLARYSPWLTFLLSIGGIGFAVAQTVQAYKLRSPSSGFPSRTCVVAFCVGIVLLFFSINQFRNLWKDASVRSYVADGIATAQKAIENGDVQEAKKKLAAVEPIANQKERDTLRAIQGQLNAKQGELDAAAANEVVRRLVSDGELFVIQGKLDKAQASLLEALSNRQANDFAGAQRLADQLATAHTKVGKTQQGLGELEAAKKSFQFAIDVPRATTNKEAIGLLAEISNREVAELVEAANGQIQNGNASEAEALLRKAASLKGATQKEHANQLLAKLVGEREAAERLARAESLRIEKERKAEETRLLAETKAREAKQLADARQRATEAEETARKKKAEEEYEDNGLVLLRKTLKGTSDGFSASITGTVVNRRKNKLAYAQITFNLYDDDGAQVGTAIANVNGLEPGGSWKFKAIGIPAKYSTYKINELSGF
jgi:hypothetical protein